MACPVGLSCQLLTVESKALLDHLQAAVSTPSLFKVDLEDQYDLLNLLVRRGTGTPARKQREYITPGEPERSNRSYSE